jgi:hypothetical protein
MSRKRVWLAAALVLALAAGIAIVASATTSSSSAKRQLGDLGAKFEGGSWADKAGIANEGPDATYEAEQAALRAYPADSVPLSATLNNIDTYTKFKTAGGHKTGQWLLLGPAKEAKYPAALDPFLAGGKEYIASGRVTAMALSPSCTGDRCLLYLGAAGGGVWVSDKALKSDAPNWHFASSSFATNAIGSLLLDPSDPTGKTVYAGTGEPNASGDSEAGMGIYKTTDAGGTWTLVPGSDAFQGRSISSMAFDGAGNLLVGVARGVRGVASVTGAATSSPPGGIALGLYRQTGATFTSIWNGAGSIRGVNEVGVDPNTSTTLYAAAFQQGVYRSVDNGATWSQIKAPLNAGFNTDRAQFALNTLPGGFTRMYVGVGNQGAPAARFYRTDDAAGVASFADMTTPQSEGYCTGQCWYDNAVTSPAGYPDIVYLSGSFDYNQVHGLSNGRAVLLSTDGGSTFSDLTIDKDNNGWVHPDQHALVTLPGKPLAAVIGDDGGVVRTSGKFKDASGDCDTRGLSVSDTAYCKSLLSRIPDHTVNLNRGLSTLQFQSLSYSKQHPTTKLQGGTQDNGTFGFNGSVNVWPQIIYGDGGQSGFSSTNEKLRFNTFTGQANDVNFRNGDPTKWVIASAPIYTSPETALFYPPIIADPSSTQGGTIFQGSKSVWRTQDWGGNQAYLEANCPEFTTYAGQAGCGDFVQIGGASSDLTAVAYGSRSGGNVIAIARATSNDGTMWVATSTGRVFITDNANDPAGSVAYTRLDSTDPAAPNRVPTAIYVDPANPNHAWISYSGYEVNTPTTPGHVFSVLRSGGSATWTNLTYNLADLPVSSVAFDDVTGDLFASTDFGVLTLPNATTTWALAAPGMPTVEVAGLTIVPGSRVLYAATHGLGSWVLNLG